MRILRKKSILQPISKIKAEKNLKLNASLVKAHLHKIPTRRSKRLKTSKITKPNRTIISVNNFFRCEVKMKVQGIMSSALL